MLTREETIKIFENCRCGAGDCNDCPMECNGNGFDELSSAVLHYLKSGKENEPALSANSTSSEVSKDTGSILHLDDSTLLDICQEGLEEISKIALDDYPNEFLTGYVRAVRNNIKRLRGEQSD